LVTAKKSPQMLREQDAQVFLDRIEDPITQQLIDIPYREVRRRFRESDQLPITDFDLKFFIEGLFLSCSCHDRIQRYLDGADNRWFPEFDDEIRNASCCPLPTSSPWKWKRGPGLHAFSLDSLVRRHEAKWFMGWHDDVATLQIVGVALAALDRHLKGRPFPGEPRLPAGCPLAPVDLLFCAQVLLEFAEQKDLLLVLLSAGQRSALDPNQQASRK
jgi:hypothetical protein